METKHQTKPIIVSVSRRTDIPAFSGDWFKARLEEGFYRYRNLFGGQTFRVSLKWEDVLCFVFWSKNYKPFLSVLTELEHRGYPFYCQFTITNYPKELEHRVPPIEKILDTAREIADRFGPHRLQWRHDPIILSSVTPVLFHVENFEYLLRHLAPYARRCYFSVDMYQKVKRQFQVLIQDSQIEFTDPSKEEKDGLLRQLAGMATPLGVRMLSCCDDSLALPGLTEKARCVDQEIVEETVGHELPSLKLNRTRKECGCYRSMDIGEYDTCLHDCRYCYTVSNHAVAVQKSRRVSPTHEFLVGPA